MARSQVFMERENDLIHVKMDESFDHLIGVSYTFYEKIMTLIQNNQNFNLQMTPRFISLINKVSSKSSSIYLSMDELALLVDWVDTLCLIMLDLDTIDYKNKQIKKYLTISEKFIKKGKEIMEQDMEKKS